MHILFDRLKHIGENTLVKNIGAELCLAPYSKITNNVAKEASSLEYLG